jgi:cysteine desulfurase/selenocysteine lyase
MTISDASSPIPLEGVGAEGSSIDLAQTMGKAIEQLANELFARGLPLPGAPGWGPPSGRPSALGVGAGGISPSLSAPSVPGPLKQPSVPVAPPPKESDFRSISGTLSDGLGPASIFPLSTAGEPAEASPYFLEIAGLPAGESRAPNRDASAFAPSPAPTAEAPVEPAAAQAYVPPSASASPAGGFRPELVPELATTPRFSIGQTIKKDFPILRERVHGKPLVWLDNAATTQKPQTVIDRLSRFYASENSNVHRAAHALAARATDAYEAARDTVRRFLNAPSTQEIVFLRGTTEAVNLVAQSWGGRYVGEGDEIVITHLEHHANIVPWQKLCADKGARLRVAPVDSRGQVILEEYEKLFGPRTRLASFSHVSNALGTVLPAREMISIAHRYGALVLVDGAQAVSHMRVDVQALDCDFYCFSGHKVFGPLGIGALYGKREVLQSMPPWQGGGNMISDVTFEKTTYQPPPQRFEAGTGSIADAVGLGAALDYVTALGMENVTRYEHELLTYATEELSRVPGLRMVGTAADKAGVLSFVIDGVRTEDVGAALDQEGIAVRAGHHCAQPILRRFGLESTVRASLAPYNTCEDIDALVAALLRLQTGRPNVRIAG